MKKAEKRKNMKNVVLGITGSIAAYKACDLIGLFRKDGMNVTCVLTKEAAHFVTPLTLESLSGNTVYADMFALPENRDPLHTSLARKADAVVIAPATATCIGKLAHGIFDDLLTCTVSAAAAPVLIAPAMNDRMYHNAIVRQNIAILKKAGCRFIGPVKGRLACGYDAVGHIADIVDIFKQAKKLLLK